MNITPHPLPSFSLRTAVLGFALLTSLGRAQDTAPNAQDISSKLSTAIQDGSSIVRLKLEMKPAGNGAKTILQLQVKARRTSVATELLYQVLWPKDRKGESFLLRKAPNQAATGTVFTPPNSLKTLSPAQMLDGIFGSDLSYEDLLGNFFSWQNQAIVGTEAVERVQCQILESKPGKSDRSSYAKVRSWIDVKNLVPMRIEKYLPSGQLERRITTTRVAKDDTDRRVPASFIVQSAGKDSTTELEGSNSRHDVTLQDSDFTPEALRALAPAK